MPVLTALSAGLVLWVCGGTNVTGNFCERKYSLHSNEVSLSTMRLGRGWEWAVKKARIDAKEETLSEADLDFCGVKWIYPRKTVIRMYLFPRRDSTGN